MSAIVFHAFALVLLLLLAYWLWSGVGLSRPTLGRGFAAVALGLAAYFAWLLYRQIV